MKKRLFLLSLVLFGTCMVFAQDIIVKINADEIEAKVVNVNDKEITYYKWENQDGPTYAISISNVLFIRYANGQKDVFSTTIENNREETKNANNASFIFRSGQTYYYDGKTMKGSAYAKFLNANCPEAYQQYTKGLSVSTAGWGLLTAGCVFDLFSIVVMYKINEKTGITLSYVAGALELACIPTLIVGYHKMHKSADIFNMQCANKKTSTAYWSINADANGIGLALNF